MSNILAGLKDFLRAHRLLFKKGLWPLFLVPGILSLLYLPLCMIFTIFFLGDFTAYVHANWIPEFLQSAATQIVISVFLWVVGVYIGFLLFRNMIMVLYSPILGFLSESAEQREFAPPGEEDDGVKFRWRDAFRSAYRGISMSALTFLFAMIGLAASFLVAFIPVIGALAAAILIPVLTVYLAGMGFCDPPLERRRRSIGESLGFAWRNRGRLFGHGLGFTLLLLVPVVGWFLAPSYGVVAGTLGAVDLLSRTEVETASGGDR